MQHSIIPKTTKPRCFELIKLINYSSLKRNNFDKTKLHTSVNSNCKKLKVDDLLLNKANSLYLNLRKIESFE